MVTWQQDPDIYLDKVEEAALLLDDAGWSLNAIARSLAVAVASDVDPVELRQGSVEIG